ncbi:MAG: hypothetical protein WA705_04045 [Candidatus Ozemobacteraceae bacterium]
MGQKTPNYRLRVVPRCWSRRLKTFSARVSLKTIYAEGYQYSFHGSSRKKETESFKIIYERPGKLFFEFSEDSHPRTIWANENETFSSTTCPRHCSVEGTKYKKSIREALEHCYCSCLWDIFSIVSNEFSNDLSCLSGKLSFLGKENVLGHDCWKIGKFSGWNVIQWVWIDCTDNFVIMIRNFKYHVPQFFNEHFRFGQYEYSLLETLGIDFSRNSESCIEQKEYKDTIFTEVKINIPISQSVFDVPDKMRVLNFFEQLWNTILGNFIHFGWITSIVL